MLPAAASKSLVLALAQINPTVGDLGGNVDRILSACEKALAAGADLVLTPELALCGYPPEDLLLRAGFFRDCEAALGALATRLNALSPVLTLVVGHPRRSAGRRYNSASVLRGGRAIACYDKRTLPNYTVFDEERYFSTGDAACVFECRGVKLGVNICEDVWGPQGPVTANPNVALDPARAGDAWVAVAPRAAREAGAELLLVLNASPYHVRKQGSRYGVMRERVRETGIPLAFANLVGGQDELVFDGASFVLDARGEVTHQFAAFEEELGIVRIDGGQPVAGKRVAQQGEEAEVYRALCLGVRDYLGKNGFPGALIGLSGGIDSALVLAIACDALGADRVRAVMMPTQYTAGISLEDSRAIVANLGVRYDEIAIRPVFDSFLSALEKDFAGKPVDATEENLQARIRGTIMMALSNKHGSIVLTTGNKSEMAVGYATLYGDMAGGFAVIKDIAKTLVYRLARWRNTVSPVIPERIITRAPSAELRPDQTDQDSLPPYDELDAIIADYMENDMSPAQIIARGRSAADVRRVVELLHRNEYKRRQAPVGIRVTHRGFGKDWRYPITSRYREPYE